MSTKVNARSGKKKAPRGRGATTRRAATAEAAEIRKVEIAEEVFARRRRGESYRAIGVAVGARAPSVAHSAGVGA